MNKSLRILVAMNLALVGALAGAVALLMAQSANAAGGVKLAYQKIETYTAQLSGCPKGYFEDKDRNTIEYLVPRDTFPFTTYSVVTGVTASTKYSSSLGGTVVTSVSPQTERWGVFRLRPCYTYAVIGVRLK
jgi:hypothetical protein